MIVTVNVAEAKVHVEGLEMDLGEVIADPTIKSTWTDELATAREIHARPDRALVLGFERNAKPQPSPDAAQFRMALGQMPVVANWLATKEQRRLERNRAKISEIVTKRIRDVADEPTQRNLTAFALSLVVKLARGETLTAQEEADLDTTQAAHAWITAMIVEARRAATDDDAPAWPAVPAGLAGLVSRL